MVQPIFGYNLRYTDKICGAKVSEILLKEKPNANCFDTA